MPCSAMYIQAEQRAITPSQAASSQAKPFMAGQALDVQAGAIAAGERPNQSKQTQEPKHARATIGGARREVDP